MKAFIEEIQRLIDPSWLTEHTLNLYRIARKQTFPAYHKEAAYAYQLLMQEGFESELVEFPADGVTDYQDKCTPIGWDASTMRLTVVSGVPGMENQVVSDFSKEPLMGVKHSVSTPPEGIVTRLVTEDQMKAGEDVRGAFVLLSQATRPLRNSIKTILDLGALGWVSDFLENPHTTPDDVAWINAGCESNSWHVGAGDRDFIGFQVTPRVGYELRKACENGSVRVHALSDGRRYESVIHGVSGLLPGEDKREVWLLAHLYEPLIDDNSSGVIGCIAILKALRELVRQGKIHLKYSVRVVFAAEMYGFSAMAEHYGGDLSGRTVGAINMDGMNASKEKAVKKEYIPYWGIDYRRCYPGNILLRCVCQEFVNSHPDYEMKWFGPTYGDDCFMNDATVGLSVVWIHCPRGYHHNSWQDESTYDEKGLWENVSFSAAWVRAMAALTKEEVTAILPGAIETANQILASAAEVPVRPGTDVKEYLRFIYEREVRGIRGLALWGDPEEIEAAIAKIRIPEGDTQTYAAEQEELWFNYTDHFVFKRLTTGFPCDLAKVPFEERKALPLSYSDFNMADIYSRMDGKKTLRTLIKESEWEKKGVMTEAKIRKCLLTCTILAGMGYLSMEVENPLTEEALIKALKKVGVKEGETLLVHSSLSGFGYLPGGTDTMINALTAAVGESGTFLAPAFARPYVMFEGSVNKSNTYRPYDTRANGELRDKTIWTGALPKAMLCRPGAKRSGHSTHEWVALGKHAEECVGGHGLLDSPTGSTSPLANALKRNGSVVFLGCGVASNTFLHYVEDLVDGKFLQPAVVKYLDEEGEPHTGLIQKHLPGHRDFYKGMDGDFYKEAVKRGLKIESQPFGLGTIYRMELAQLYEIAMDMFREDPNATLCKDPGCGWCRKFRK